MWESVASMLQASSFASYTLAPMVVGRNAGALKAYRKALEIHRALKKEAAAKLAAQLQSQTASQAVDPLSVYVIPLRLLNNTAVLLYRWVW